MPALTRHAQVSSHDSLARSVVRASQASTLQSNLKAWRWLVAMRKIFLRLTAPTWEGRVHAGRVTDRARGKLRPARRRALGGLSWLAIPRLLVRHCLWLALNELRIRPTPSEQALWLLPRGSQLGVAFRRQVVVAGFLADFVAPSLQLIVEVDGGYHARRRVADARRDAKLRRAGHRVLRLSADVVLAEPETALALLRQALRPR